MNPIDPAKLGALPTFERPPVDELVLGLQFSPLKGMSASHMGLYWAPIRREYPQTEEKPAIDATIEVFGERKAQPVPVFRLLDRPETPRVWFIGASGNNLIQLQNDRLHVNWRRRLPDDVYPRYGVIRKLFVAEIVRLQSFAESEGLGTLSPTQCEITYINVIDVADKGFEGLDRIFSVWASIPATPGTQVETCQFALRFLLPDEKGQPVGRLTLQVQPAYRQSDELPVYRMELTARGR